MRRRMITGLSGIAIAVVLSSLQVALAHPSADHERSGAAAVAAAPGSPWGPDYFPNVPLVTQDGKTVRFFDDLIQGKVVAISFMFTGCSDVCPLETARLREVQRILGERVGRDIFFYSISIDPMNDTPAALKRYIEKFDIGPGWTFLTGKEEDITLLRRKLGVYDEEEKNPKNHNLSMVIGNQATGIWKKTSPYENPHFLANDLGRWLHNWKQPTAKRNNYAHAPKLRQISRGEELFRTRCASCHSVGTGQNSFTAQRPIGPDLTNVTRIRDRAWLARWIKEPDRMLAEKDPLATALLAEYRNVAMPNLRLNDVEVNALLGYLDAKGGKSSDLKLSTDN